MIKEFNCNATGNSAGTMILSHYKYVFSIMLFHIINFFKTLQIEHLPEKNGQQQDEMPVINKRSLGCICIFSLGDKLQSLTNYLFVCVEQKKQYMKQNLIFFSKLIKDKNSIYETNNDYFKKNIITEDERIFKQQAKI